MPKFSSKFQYDPRVPKETVLEDAPSWMRTAYLNTILDSVTYIDMDDRYTNPNNLPLGVKSLYKQFCGMVRQEEDSTAFDSWHCWEFLKSEISNTPWYYFYDFVEHVGKRLREIDQQDPLAEGWSRTFGFDNYKEKVNHLFQEERIGWRLNEESELTREIPKALVDRVSKTTELLVSVFEPARVHYGKACRYVLQSPLDPENAIKEVISAIESAGRVLNPGTKTLGDVVKEMRRKKAVPSLLISMIEKFYAYASDEPAVRHGSAVSSGVQLADAEFCLHVGGAFLRYLIETDNIAQKTRQQVIAERVVKPNNRW
jgi:hypothetical protein